MSIFKDKFKALLNEQPVADEVTDADAMAATLDDGSAPEDFDANVPDPAAGAMDPSEVMKGQNAQMIGTLQEWIGEMERFSDYLNGLDEGSIQSQLNNAACDTLFNKISSSETKKISRVAQDLRSVIESLKAYMLSNDE